MGQSESRGSYSTRLSSVAPPATAANCILTDYQHGAVNHQKGEPRGRRVRGCFQSIEMEKNMSKTRQSSRGMRMSEARL